MTHLNLISTFNVQHSRAIHLSPFASVTHRIFAESEKESCSNFLSCIDITASSIPLDFFGRQQRIPTHTFGWNHGFRSGFGCQRWILPRSWCQHLSYTNKSVLILSSQQVKARQARSIDEAWVQSPVRRRVKSSSLNKLSSRSKFLTSVLATRQFAMRNAPWDSMMLLPRMSVSTLRSADDISGVDGNSVRGRKFVGDGAFARFLHEKASRDNIFNLVLRQRKTLCEQTTCLLPPTNVSKNIVHHVRVYCWSITNYEEVQSSTQVPICSRLLLDVEYWWLGNEHNASTKSFHRGINKSSERKGNPSGSALVEMLTSTSK